MDLKLYGYFAGNLGDDLMLRILLERYPDVRFFAETWAAESDVFREYPNFTNLEALQSRYGRLNRLLNILTGYANRDFFLRRIRQGREDRCRGSVYIGGSVYTARTPVEREEEKLSNGPLFVIGANFAGDGAAYRDYFRRCGGVTFRERLSFRLFAELGNVALAPDVVLGLPVQPEASDGSLVISVMDLTRRPETAPWASDYEDFLVELCRNCHRPVLVSFCRKEGDEAAAERIAGRLLPERKVPILRYRGDSREILDAFARADRVIATRFHAMILAFCYRKPVFAVSYSEKIENVAKDMDFMGYCPLSKLKNREASDLLDRCALPENLDDWCRRAEEQFAQLDKFLEDHHG